MNGPKTEGASWKERFAFVSGNVLVLGFLLLKLWPAVAAYQTGLHLHFWTWNLPHEGVRSEHIFFLAMCGILTAAGASVALAVMHIYCRGLWLSISAGADTGKALRYFRDLLDRTCQRTCGAVYVLTAIVALVVLFTVLMLACAFLEQLLVKWLNLEQGTAGWIARGVVAVGLPIVLITVVTRLVRKVQSHFDHLSAALGEIPDPPDFWGVVCLGFLVIVPVVLETCYTVHIDVNQRLFTRARDDFVEVYSELGGATSDPSVAGLYLLDPDERISRALDFQSIGGGSYLSHIALSTLRPGRYQVVLEYPHISFSDRFPFLRGDVHKSVWFVVGESAERDRRPPTDVGGASPGANGVRNEGRRRVVD
ncbi:MAG: hypothetical protein JSU86_10445 [Phycisphaerales bacterium]|nr:MAG: hypothetical protein JSU86_10445 [Phycisphaerales bacterium]